MHLLAFLILVLYTSFRSLFLKLSRSLKALGPHQIFLRVQLSATFLCSSDTVMSSKKATHYIQEGGVFIELTHNHLEISAIMDRVRSPKAGAMVLFAGEERSVVAPRIR